MKYTGESFGNTVEILAADEFVALPFTVTESADVVKAGTPMSLDGKKNESKPDGILLYDVRPNDNPNAALVVQGVIDKVKAEAHSGATITVETFKTAVPGLIFRENIGVTKAD